jgi:hypothetical protein
MFYWVENCHYHSSVKNESQLPKQENNSLYANVNT